MHNISCARTLSKLRPEWTELEQIEWQYLPGGYANDNYAFHYAGVRWVLRIPTHDSGIDRRFEHSYYLRLPESLGVKPTAFDSQTGAMLSRWIEGRLLVEAWTDGGLSISHLVSYLVDLHSALPKVDRYYETELRSPINIKSCIPCHNDLNPWNIIVADDGTWRTLDWEWVGLNDPLFDLVGLHQGLELEDGLLDLAEVYCTRRGECNDIDARLAWAYQAFWHRQLAWASDEIAKGNNRAEIVEQRDTAQDKLRSPATG